MLWGKIESYLNFGPQISDIMENKNMIFMFIPEIWANVNEQRDRNLITNMFGEVCSNFTHTFKWDNETYAFDHELECTVSRTVLVLFSFIGVAGLVGNALVVLGEILFALSLFRWNKHSFSIHTCSCGSKSHDEIDNQHFNYQFSCSRFAFCNIL